MPESALGAARRAATLHPPSRLCDGPGGLPERDQHQRKHDVEGRRHDGDNPRAPPDGNRQQQEGHGAEHGKADRGPEQRVEAFRRRVEVVSKRVCRNGQRAQQGPLRQHDDPSRAAPRQLCRGGKPGAEQHDVDDDGGKVVPAGKRADREAVRDVEEGEQVGPDADEPQRGERQPDRQVTPHALALPPQPVKYAGSALCPLRCDDLEALRAGSLEGFGCKARMQVIASAREPAEHRILGRDKLDHRGIARQVGAKVQHIAQRHSLRDQQVVQDGEHQHEIGVSLRARQKRGALGVAPAGGGAGSREVDRRAEECRADRPRPAARRARPLPRRRRAPRRWRPPLPPAR